MPTTAHPAVTHPDRHRKLVDALRPLPEEMPLSQAVVACLAAVPDASLGAFEAALEHVRDDARHLAYLAEMDWLRASGDLDLPI